MKIAVLFVGALHDTGFNACALDGAEAARDLPGAEIEIVQGVPFDPAAMTEALTGAVRRSDAVIFIGGQGNRVTPEVARLHPGHPFAIVQGEVTAPNIASYDVLQEHSAFLAGFLAARVTRTGRVGHLSGHRVTPGLKGRAAFAAGVAHADTGVRLLTGFCGTQDDGSVTEAWAGAIAAQGADVLFTMLNAARDGATRACRAAGIRQIGNVGDWTATDPETYIASAVARIDLGVLRAASDLLAGVRPAEVQPLGLTDGAVRLALASDVAPGIAAELDDLAAGIAAGRIPVATTYDGPEFAPPPA
jgi:basic membrane protein A